MFFPKMNGDQGMVTQLRLVTTLKYECNTSLVRVLVRPRGTSAYSFICSGNVGKLPFFTHIMFSSEALKIPIPYLKGQIIIS